MKARIASLLFICIALLSSGPVHARPLQCTDIPQLFEVYLRNHYAYHQMTDAIRAHTVDQFVKYLDPSKTNLLEEDINALKKQLSAAFGEVQRGNCGSLTGVQDLVVKRMKETKEYLDQFLGANYKFDPNTDLIFNPDLRGYAKTIAERNAYLSKLTHFQVSNYLLSDTKLDEAKRLIKKRNELALKRLQDRKVSELYDLYAEAFAHALDPHSSYMSHDALEEFQISMQLSLEGIGASLSSEDGYTVIEELIPGGAADKSKQLRTKDKIIAVAQDGKPPVTVMDMDLKDVVKLIRGKKGTKVKLTILRQGDKTENFQLTLVRDKVDLKEQAAKINYETRKVGDKSVKIGYIELPSFYGGGKGEGRSCYQDLKNLVQQAKDAKVDGIVLDLSRNGGGLLDQAVQIAGLFIKRGGVVATKNTDGRVEVLDDQDPDVFYSGPLVLLTSRMSASASEILAGALKDYKRALVVGGDHTFGKGTVQVLAPLPDNLGAMKVTTGMFFLPSGMSTQHQGVSSDIVIPSLLNNEEAGEKKMDYSLAQQKIDSFFSKDINSTGPNQHWVTVTPDVVSKLSEKALKRIAANPKFTEVRKELDDSARNKGMIHLADIRKKAADDKKKNGGKKEKKRSRISDPEDLKDDAFVQESIDIMADYIAAQRA